MDSPFNWQGRSSQFAYLPAFNGISEAKSKQMSEMDKAHLAIGGGKYLPKAHKQVFSTSNPKGKK